MRERPVRTGRGVQGRRGAGSTGRPVAALADVFVSDGFGVVHRKQASVYDVAKRLPSAAGGLVLTEVNVLRRLTENPVRPYVVVLGGAKVSDKLAVIANLLKTADRAGDRRGNGVHLPGCRGVRGGQEPARRRTRSRRSGIATSPPAAASRSCCPPTSSWHRSSPPTRPPRSSPPTPSRPTRRGWTSAPIRSPCSRGALGGAGTVFWNGPMGVCEVGEVRRGHQWGGRGPHRGVRPDGGRRRRFRSRRPRPGHRRERVRPHFHRRRRDP